MSRAPASLREVVEDCDSGQMATVKKELLTGAATLAKAAKKCGIRGQVWWVKPDEKKGKTRKSGEVSVVEEESGDPEVALLSKQLSQLVTIVEGIKSQQIAAVSAGAEKQKEENPEQELERLRKEKESGEWAQRYTGRGGGSRRKGDKGGKGGGGKGPQTGCCTCGGPHYSNQCPWNTGGK